MTRHVQDLMEVVGGGRLIAVGPQLDHGQFAKESMVRGEGQEFKERGRLVQPPVTRVDGALSHPEAKRPEQLDPQRRSLVHDRDLPADHSHPF